MQQVDDINAEIARLEALIPTVQGRKTEVYSRIVGYYRAVDNWNVGKHQEFEERKTFDVGG